jgi:hypothetical protein
MARGKGGGVGSSRGKRSRSEFEYEEEEEFEEEFEVEDEEVELSGELVMVDSRRIAYQDMPMFVARLSGCLACCAGLYFIY